MNNIINSLIYSPLFEDFSAEEIEIILKKITPMINSYGKNQIIALEGSECKSVGIVIKGSIEIKKVFASGRSLTVTRMEQGSMFGEVLMFAQPNKYPSTLFSGSETQILYITKNSLLELCRSNSRITANMMALLSNKVLVLSEKIKYLSYQTIRQKVSRFIMDEYEKQGRLSLRIPLTREKMAELLGVTRPSLSREMIKMREENIINFKKKEISVISLKTLEDIILG